MITNVPELFPGLVQALRPPSGEQQGDAGEQHQQADQAASGDRRPAWA
jgi:hypothetical protein